MSELALHDQRIPTPAEYALLHWSGRKRAAALLWRVHTAIDAAAVADVFDPATERAAAAALLKLMQAEPREVTARRRTQLLQAVSGKG